MWVQRAKQYHGPKSRSGHVRQNIAWTRPWVLVLHKGHIGDKKSSSRVAQPKLGAFTALNLPLVSIPHPTRMPDGPAKRPGKYYNEDFGFKFPTKFDMPFNKESKPKRLKFNSDKNHFQPEKYCSHEVEWQFSFLLKILIWV